MYAFGMDNTTTVTASEARQNLYSLIREASKGFRAFEIKLRGTNPVILMSKEELEGWLETLDIMASPEEAGAIKEARGAKKTISHKEMKKLLGLQ